MRKLLLAGLVIACAYLSGRWVLDALRSDADRIRDLITGIADGFNSRHARACLEPLHRDFREETADASKDDIHRILAFLFLGRVDADSGRFIYRVQVPPDALDVVVDPRSGDRARVELVARFEKRSGAAWSLLWEARISAELGQTEDGWKIRRSRHETLRGKRRF